MDQQGFVVKEKLVFDPLRRTIPRTVRRIFTRCGALRNDMADVGSIANYQVHESAYVDDGCRIGAGSKIWHFCHVMYGAVLGERCNIGQNVVMSADVVLGNNVKVQNNVSIYTGVMLDDDVFCGPSMVFTNVVNPRSHVVRKHEYGRRGSAAAPVSARTAPWSAATTSASTPSSAPAPSSRRTFPTTRWSSAIRGGSRLGLRMRDQAGQRRHAARGSGRARIAASVIAPTGSSLTRSDFTTTLRGTMELSGKRIMLIGGAGLVGSHIVDQLIHEPVSEIVVFDNFIRGTRAT